MKDYKPYFNWGFHYWYLPGGLRVYGSSYIFYGEYHATYVGTYKKLIAFEALYCCQYPEQNDK